MRMSVPAALASLILGLSVLFLDAAPAQAASVFLEVNPSTVPTGDEVGLRASCDDNLKSAVVSSGLFGTVTVVPQYGLLTATVRVPSSTRPDDYTINLRCPDGKTASANLHVVAKVEPARGPATGGGGTAPDRYAPAMIGGGLVLCVAGVVLGILSLRRRRFG
jgi:hypothetical protein